MDIAKVVAALKEQCIRIDQAIVALEGRPPRAVSATNRPGRHMSAAAANGFQRREAAMGKVKGEVCSQEGQEPSSNECRCQEEVVCVDEAR